MQFLMLQNLLGKLNLLEATKTNYVLTNTSFIVCVIYNGCNYKTSL